MKLDGRRTSSNVEDRRGGGMKVKGGLGLGGLIIAGLLVWIFGGDPTSVFQLADSNEQANESTAYTASAAEQELFDFASQILAGTEDVWTAEFKKMGRKYVPPKLVIFTDAVQSGCGNATSQSGPFYCSADQKVYLDLDFFLSMRKQLGADGDFAYAYVIAHEVGHHVQYLLGTLNKAHQEMARLSEKEANKISVRLELQADYYAGVWAHHDNEMFNSLEEGDIEEGLNVAAKIGDDYLQKKARGYAVPDSFNHGTSAQRARWLKKGISTGSMADGDTFTPQYAAL
ncbi:MAG: neutral zinc metallopeptidase [Bacteroidales bacterium]|nr:neutral zinc metallopeptidase [Bacteroidales bacterium]